MKIHSLAFTFIFLTTIFITHALQAKTEIKNNSEPPNIIIIMTDDIGYGDLSCYGATHVSTPNTDRLAAKGLKFIDGHSMAAVCTPSRYAMLTGEYAFRKKGTEIASGEEGMLIASSQLTLPSLLKKKGYSTGIIGKWHLGLGKKPTNYNTEITPGPTDVGFDYAWMMPSTVDRVPCVWIENKRVVNLDPADPIKLDYSVKRGDPLSYVNEIPRIGSQQGGKAALWKDDEISLVLADKSIRFIEKHKEKPFFLYLATHSIHVPRIPNEQFKGLTKCGERGDAIVEMDWIVGQITETIEKLNLTQKTLIIFTSDNGGVNNAKLGIGTPESTYGHKCNGQLRGFKGSLYEGGTRVPFIASWPGKIPAGISSALVCQVDLLATAAALTNQSIPQDAAIDSINILPELMQPTSNKQCRTHLITQNNEGNQLALRMKSWKYIPSYSPGTAAELYNLADDISESNNIASKNPQIVKRMNDILNQQKDLRQIQ